MFDTLVAVADRARTPVDRVRAFARVENAACARRLAGMADILERAYAAAGSAERDQWVFDNWAAVCALIGACHDITSGVASGLLSDARTLRERLPRVAAVFATGIIAYRLVHLICQRTALVKDPDALRLIDADLALLIAGAGAMSVDGAQSAIDTLVQRHDPYAVRRTRDCNQSRGVRVAVDDATGRAHIEATVAVPDGLAFDRRLDALAATVCDRDPRDADALRAAAVGALGFGWDRIPCLCEHPDCDAATKPPVGGIVIHMVARRDTVEGAHDAPLPPEPDDGLEPPPDPRDDTGPGVDDDAPDTESDDPDADVGDDADHTVGESGADAADGEDSAGADDGHEDGSTDAADADRQTADATVESEPSSSLPAPVGDPVAQRRSLAGPAEPMLPKPWYTYTWSGLTAALAADRGEYCPNPPGLLFGAGVVPAPVVAEAAMFAAVRRLVDPADAAPEPHYRPSRTLADWVRCRDWTCRFPGCTKPATGCQIDHVTAWPYGPTAASNLACLCTEHHLLKTFWPGWSYTLAPDGTAKWRYPDGHTYTTVPGSRLLFPELSAPSTGAVTAGTPPPKHTAGLTMPRRKVTRAQARARRIDDERRANTEAAEQYLRECIPPF